tara:strand:+ start:17560 stop:17853 length:294 start_codon:yes stop_codon:yes gene_type:complete
MNVPVFESIHHEQSISSGDDANRFATDWVFGGDRFRVSSVHNDYTTETMIFHIDEDGEVNYFQWHSDREYRSTIQEHEDFITEWGNPRQYDNVESCS